MKIQYMMEFVYLVEKLNFTATASEFHLTQPTVSKHVQMLEDALGLPLLARTTHTVEVTEAGGAAYASFKRILQEHDRLMADMERLRHDLSGELRVGVLYYGIREYVQPFVNAFRKALPQIKVIYVSCQNYQVFELLKNGRIDIGIVARVDEEAVAQFDYVPIKREHLKCMIS